MPEVQKISASLLNSWIYYKNNPTDKAYESFLTTLKGEFKGNYWTRRGNKFEEEVFQGEHGKLSQLVESLPKQVWSNRNITVDGINIKISGKVDAIDYDKKSIYDIKRMNEYYKGKLDDSMQHPIYFFLNKDITNFYYLIVVGKGSEDTKLHIEHYKRPEEKELKKIILNTIREFFEFLKSRDIFNVYLENQKTKPYQRRQ
jgi:hypothetical protein